MMINLQYAMINCH